MIKFKKPIAFFTFLLFTMNTFAYAAPEISLSSLKAKDNILLPLNIQIPETLGVVEEEILGSGPIVIHIEDAHADYQAQKNIQAIIEHLEKTQDFNQLFLEGGAGELTPESFHFFEEHSLNQKVVDDLMQQGLFSGAEAFLVDNTETAQGFGIEDIDTYRKNLQQFREVIQTKETHVWTEEQKQILSTQISKTFPKELREIVSLRQKLDLNQISLLSYVNLLNHLVKKHLSIDLQDKKHQWDYPSLVRLVRLKEMKTTNLEQIQSEKKAWLEKLEELNLDNELMEKLENIEKQKFPRFVLEQLHQAKGGKLSLEDFPAWKNYLQQLMYQTEVDSKGLFQEIESLSGKLYKGLVQTPAQQSLLKKIKSFHLFEKLLLLELTREEYGKLKIENLDVMLPEEIETVLEGAKSFYREAIKREFFFTQNLLSQMKENKNPKSILVTGGFHSEGIKKKIRELNFSYVRIRPHVGSSIESRKIYLNTLLEENKTKIASIANVLQIMPEATQQKMGVSVKRRFFVNAAVSRAASLGEEELPKIPGAKILTLSLGELADYLAENLESQFEEAGRNFRTKKPNAVLDSFEIMANARFIDADTVRFISQPRLATGEDGAIVNTSHGLLSNIIGLEPNDFQSHWMRLIFYLYPNDKIVINFIHNGFVRELIRKRNAHKSQKEFDYDLSIRDEYIKLARVFVEAFRKTPYGSSEEKIESVRIIEAIGVPWFSSEEQSTIKIGNQVSLYLLSQLQLLSEKIEGASLGETNQIEKSTFFQKFWEAPLWFKVPVSVGVISTAAALLFGLGLPEAFKNPIASFFNNITIFGFFVALADILGQWISGAKYNLKQTFLSFFPLGLALGTMTFVGYGIINYLVPQDSQLTVWIWGVLLSVSALMGFKLANFYNSFKEDVSQLQHWAFRIAGIAFPLILIWHYLPREEPLPEFVVGIVRVLGTWVVIRSRTIPYAWLVKRVRNQIKKEEATTSADKEDAKEALDAQEKQYESFWMSRVPSFIKNYVVMMFFPPHLAVILEGIATQYFQLFYSWSVNKKGFMIKKENLRGNRMFLFFLGFIWWLGVQRFTKTETKKEPKEEIEAKSLGAISDKDNKITRLNFYKKVRPYLAYLARKNVSAPFAAKTPDLFLLLGHGDPRTFYEFSGVWRDASLKGHQVPIVIAGGRGRGTDLLVQKIMLYAQDNKIPFTEEERALILKSDISEAEIIKMVLVKQEIPEELITVETKSTNTPENFVNSLAFVKQLVGQDALIQVVTNPPLNLRAHQTGLKKWEDIIKSQSWQLRTTPVYMPRLQKMTEEDTLEFIAYVLGLPSGYQPKNTSVNRKSETERIAEYGTKETPDLIPLDFSETEWSLDAVRELRETHFRDFLQQKGDVPKDKWSKGIWALLFFIPSFFIALGVVPDFFYNARALSPTFYLHEFLHGSNSWNLENLNIPLWAKTMTHWGPIYYVLYALEYVAHGISDGLVSVFSWALSFFGMEEEGGKLSYIIPDAVDLMIGFTGLKVGQTLYSLKNQTRLSRFGMWSSFTVAFGYFAFHTLYILHDAFRIGDFSKVHHPENGDYRMFASIFSSGAASPGQIFLTGLFVASFSYLFVTAGHWLLSGIKNRLQLGSIRESFRKRVSEKIISTYKSTVLALSIFIVSFTALLTSASYSTPKITPASPEVKETDPEKSTKKRERKEDYVANPAKGDSLGKSIEIARSASRPNSVEAASLGSQQEKIDERRLRRAQRSHRRYKDPLVSLIHMVVTADQNRLLMVKSVEGARWSLLEGAPVLGETVFEASKRILPLWINMAAQTTKAIGIVSDPELHDVYVYSPVMKVVLRDQQLLKDSNQFFDARLFSREELKSIYLKMFVNPNHRSLVEAFVNDPQLSHIPVKAESLKFADPDKRLIETPSFDQAKARRTKEEHNYHIEQGKTQHNLTSVGLVEVTKPNGEYLGVMLQQIKKGAYKGQWSLSGGHPSHGESAVYAGMREIYEETSLVATKPHFLGILPPSYPGSPESYIQSLYSFQAKGYPNPDNKEVSAIAFVKNFEELNEFARNNILAWSVYGTVAKFLLEKEGVKLPEEITTLVKSLFSKYAFDSKRLHSVTLALTYLIPEIIKTQLQNVNLENSNFILSSMFHYYLSKMLLDTLQSNPRFEAGALLRFMQLGDQDIYDPKASGGGAYFTQEIPEEFKAAYEKQEQENGRLLADKWLLEEKGIFCFRKKQGEEMRYETWYWRVNPWNDGATLKLEDEEYQGLEALSLTLQQATHFVLNDRNANGFLLIDPKSPLAQIAEASREESNSAAIEGRPVLPSEYLVPELQLLLGEQVQDMNETLDAMAEEMLQFLGKSILPSTHENLKQRLRLELFKILYVTQMAEISHLETVGAASLGSIKEREVDAIIYVTETVAGGIYYLPEADQTLLVLFKENAKDGKTEIKTSSAVNAFNRDITPVLNLVPQNVRGPQSRLPLIVFDDVLKKRKETARQMAHQLSSALKPGDLFVAVWEGDDKPSVLSQLYREANTSEFQVRDIPKALISEARVQSLTRKIETAPVAISSLYDTSDLELELRGGDKIKLDLSSLIEKGVNPIQVVKLIRALSDNLEARKVLFERIGFKWNEKEGFWTVGKDFTQFLETIYTQSLTQQLVLQAA